MGSMPQKFPAEYGYDLWVVYVVWIGVIAMLYALCPMPMVRSTETAPTGLVVELLVTRAPCSSKGLDCKRRY